MKNLIELIKILKIFWSVLNKRRKAQIIILLLLNIISNILEIISIASIMPFIATISDTKNFLNSNFAKKIFIYFDLSHNNFILFFTLLFIILNLISGIFRFTTSYLNTVLSFKAGSDIGQKIYKNSLSQNYEYHTKTNSSNLISIISSKAGTIITQAVSPAINIINSSSLFLIIFSALLYINFKITILIITIICIVYYFIILIIKPIINKEGKNTSLYLDEQMKILQESFGGIREILLNNTLEYQIDKYNKAERNLRNSQSRSGVISNAPRFIIEPAGMILLAFVSYFLYTNTNNFTNTFSLIVVIALSLQRLLPVTHQLYSNWSIIANSKSSLIDIIDLLDLKINYINILKSEKFQFNSFIKLEKISFKYETRNEYIIKDLDFTIFKGKTIGIIGESGEGKSTLIDIISGLLFPNQGNIFIDDQKIDNFQKYAKWRNTISVVSQRIFLTDSTLKENIAFGTHIDEIDDQKLFQAIKMANLENTINKLPNGINTLMGERGVQLSGGQLQRIGIARAFYNSASVLILDEYTSSLDSKTEEEIINSISEIKEQFTIIIVSHKKSNLRICDSIYKLSNSKLYLVQNKN